MLYAHYDKETNHKQQLADHLHQVAQQMVCDLEAVTFPNYTKEKLFEVLWNVGLYHDIGKAMAAFQRYLYSGRGGSEKNHAFISAAIFSFLYETKDLLAYAACMAIIKHHTSIDSEMAVNTHYFSQLTQQYADCFAQLKQEPIADISMTAVKLDDKVLEEFLASKLYFVSKRRRSETGFFLFQYIFSKLIWADKLDSAQIQHASGEKPITIATVTAYLAKKQVGQPINLNDKRTKIKAAVLDKINSLTDLDIRTRRVFSLTAPTGTGKTLTSICAALQLAERIHKIYGYRPMLITALPFINILEQTRSEYEAIFDDVLVHYSANEYNDFAEGENIPLQDRLLLTNAWESNVVITTFVQLFESVLGTKNTYLLKLNKLAGSIVILDEIQALPSIYYPLLGAVIEHVSQYYGTRFILMTATQPEIIASANKLLPKKNMQAVELLENSSIYYKGLTRTRLIPVFDQVKDNETLVQWIKKTKPPHAAAVVVVNTIAQSIAVYNQLKEVDTVLYLSTNLIGRDRKMVIARATTLLSAHKPFILVSTQTIEAGVDLDFDIGYRDLGPLESIVQIAGRVNRSGSKADFSPVYVFDTGSAKSVYKNYHLKQSKDLLREEIKENHYAEFIQNYYKILAEDSSYDKEYYEAIVKLDYQKIEQFHLIDNKQDIKTVVIVCDDKIETWLTDYCELVKKRNIDFADKAKLKQFMHKMSPYTVDIRIKKLILNRPCTFYEIYGIHLDWYVVQRTDLANYYDETGFVSESKEAFLY